MAISVQFLGGAGTVTGSKFLVETEQGRILVDAGLFQGRREWRERNWDDFPCDPSTIKAVLLTHAHIDHTGILPRLVAQGLRCPVICTKATFELAKIMLPDSARLHEEEAEWRRRDKNRSRHENPLPLYTSEDAKKTLELFRAVQFENPEEILPGVHATFRHMGHIIGAASIALEIGDRLITFSGDIGRYTVPILKDPDPAPLGDLLLIESTYGTREHPDQNPKHKLAQIVKESIDRGGALIIPSFAVGRTQLVLFYLRELKEEGVIPDVPVIVDSPMARDATGVYKEARGCYDDESLGIVSRGGKPFHPSKLHFIKDRQESMKLNDIHEPMVLISASGMLSGGRILHHLRQRISRPDTTLLFVGYQPPGGRGDWIKNGDGTVRLFGEEHEVNATIEEISGLSAHGDRSEMLTWARSCNARPGKVAVVHGEPDSAAQFANTLQEKMQWNAFAPDYKETIELD